MSSQELIHSIIQRIATGPDLSKDIDFEEARLGMEAILKGEVDDVRSAIFLIALRMKRETMDENKGILAAIQNLTTNQKVDVENLIDIGDPYSGYNRSIPVSSFLPPLLAELGLPALIHGLNSVSPKFGLTHRHVSELMGCDVNMSSSSAKDRIENAQIGWAYLDQSQYCSGLHDLVELRDRVIKRTVLNTVETLIGPLRGNKTHSILGYVHKPYPPIYADLVNASGMDTALLIRGVEGGVIPSLRQKGLMISYSGVEEQDRVDIDPSELGIKQEMRAIAFPEGMSVEKNITELAKYTFNLGIDALSGKEGMFFDGLVLGASLVLWHTNKVNSLSEASEKVRETLKSGRTLSRLKK
jgi:anthranilate phosphoribosyltransferase